MRWIGQARAPRDDCGSPRSSRAHRFCVPAAHVAQCHRVGHATAAPSCDAWLGALRRPTRLECRASPGAIAARALRGARVSKHLTAVQRGFGRQLWLGLLAFVLLAVGLAGLVLLKADAARLANSLRLAGPVTVGIIGLGLILAGRIGVGTMIISAALAWYGSSRARRQSRKSPGARSTVRTAALEMAAILCDLEPGDHVVEIRILPLERRGRTGGHLAGRGRAPAPSPRRSFPDGRRGRRSCHGTSPAPLSVARARAPARAGAG